MKKIILLFCIISVQARIHSQPYLDIVKLNYSYSPMNGLNEKNSPLQSNFFTADVTLPIELKKGGDAIIVNPFFTNNIGEVATNDFHVTSKALLVGFLKKDIFPNWNLLSSFIVRRNTQVDIDSKDDWQYGGIILTTWKKNQDVSFKFGLYYNKEFFGNYFMPLVGLDWKIDAKNNLFGVLPGYMIFEHKVAPRFYFGFAFRALTNSYREETIDPCFSGDCTGRNYLRIDDNPLGIYADTYLSKKIVLSAEAGYTILRRYRYGFKGDNIHYKADYKNDNFYFKASLAYRLRLR
ncbi:MAG TPA: DUF6268 family outer membrane beta-barrel protein [Chitinophagaceae bacterium]|nr:DUF6268 family outer membrane beta-barrel protein [Chitinophagaceae bacterium]